MEAKACVGCINRIDEIFCNLSNLFFDAGLEGQRSATGEMQRDTLQPFTSTEIWQQDWLCTMSIKFHVQ